MVAFDAAQGIFNNVPSRISVCELDLQLPCHPEYFELANYEEMLRRSSFPRAKMKLLDAFQRLFTSPSEFKASIEKDAWCCWDMLYLIHRKCPSHSTDHGTWGPRH